MKTPILHDDPGREAGFSMVEVVISASILAVLSMGAVVFFGGAMTSMDKSVDAARVINQGTSGLISLERDLASAEPGHIWIQSVSGSFDELLLQVPIDVTSSGPLWGAVCSREVVVEGEAIQRHPEWKVRYRVVGTQLVRDVVDKKLQPVPNSEVSVARDLVSAETLSRMGREGNEGGDLKVFKVRQIDPQKTPNLYSVRISTAVPKMDPHGQVQMGPIQAHRGTIRANRH